jgi:glycosyltransferase involved in cell wall biosynthesis
MLGFLVATYNEEAEILSLLDSVKDLADFFVVSDDGSTDRTVSLVHSWGKENNKSLYILHNAHTGLPETVKKKGADFIASLRGQGCWVLMLDADERLAPTVSEYVKLFMNDTSQEEITHIWFGLQEYMDGVATRGFEKCRMFRAGAARFSESVHEDDRFEGQGAAFGWVVIHRKTKEKQIMREKEYLQTYQKLLTEGKVTQEWVDRCTGFHYFVKELGLVPHG